VIAVTDFLAIGSCHWLEVAGFYGSSMLRVAGYPLWWAPFDVVIVCGGGTLLLALRPFLRCWYRILIVTIPLVMTALVTGLFSPLITTALRDQCSAPGMVAASLGTLAIGAGVLFVTGKIVVNAPRWIPAVSCSDRPADEGQHAPSFGDNTIHVTR
jgi:hypothetical protein